FLCNISDNIYAINFVAFKIRQVNEGSEVILFEVTSPEGAEAPPPAVDGDDSSRFIRYHFAVGPKLPAICTLLRRSTSPGFRSTMAAVDYSQQYAEHEQQAEGLVQVTPDYVQSLTGPTDGFLCNISDNIYNINFVAFKIRQVNEGSEVVLFEVTSPEGAEAPPPAVDGDDSSRFIRYHFGPEFLDIPTVGTTLEFTIGDQPVHNFRMIEKHYFRHQLLIDYDFSVPFVIPNTRSTWEMIYTKPELTQEWKDALISAPWECRSDSFYFVQDRLIMHNRAEYNYAPR
ncbi:unnamed protein product, partial [Polarella glacialis]